MPTVKVTNPVDMLDEFVGQWLQPTVPFLHEEHPKHVLPYEIEANKKTGSDPTLPVFVI